jgi:CO/xanthine dehydrogenase FAD-binding subunit
MNPDEMVVDIVFPALDPDSRGIFVKNALRKAQAISVVNVCLILKFHGLTVTKANISIGSVAPTVIMAKKASNFIIGKELNIENIGSIAELTAEDAKPINDLRSSGDYRKEIVKIIIESSPTIMGK